MENKKQERKNKIWILIFLGIFIFLISILNLSALTIKNVVSDPEEIQPGESARISIVLENNFNKDVENVNVILDFSSSEIPIAPFQGSSEDSVESIGNNEEETVNFKIIALPEALSGIYKIPVKIEYNFDGENNTIEKETTISVIVNSPPKIKISVEGGLVKGMENMIILRVVNDGLSEARFASVQIQQPLTGVVNSPLYEYLGDIDSDDFDSIEIKIFADEDSSSRISLPITINYKDSTNRDFTKNETLILNVYTKEEAARLGLIQKPNYTLYVIAGILIFVYVVYLVRKRIRKKESNER